MLFDLATFGSNLANAKWAVYDVSYQRYGLGKKTGYLTDAILLLYFEMGRFSTLSSAISATGRVLDVVFYNLSVTTENESVPYP